jgi:hypothetical protein
MNESLIKVKNQSIGIILGITFKCWEEGRRTFRQISEIVGELS